MKDPPRLAKKQFGETIIVSDRERKRRDALPTRPAGRTDVTSAWAGICYIPETAPVNFGLKPKGLLIYA